MSRMLSMVTMLAAAMLTACGASTVGGNDINDDGPKLDKPMAPGANFTDLPPLEPPVSEQASPERKPERQP